MHNYKDDIIFIDFYIDWYLNNYKNSTKEDAIKTINMYFDARIALYDAMKESYSKYLCKRRNDIINNLES